MNIPQGYKQTELGIIPEDWEVKPIGECLSIGNGCDYKDKPFGNIPVYGTGGVITYINDYLYDGQTICIGRKGTINKPLYYEGKIWTVDTLYYTYNFIDVDVKYIYYLLLTIDWMSLNEATGVPSLTSDRIRHILLALPPVAEQRAIAEALSDIDGLIAALDKKIAKKRLIKQGAMQQLLTGKKRLPGFSDPWVEKRLGDMGHLMNGYTFKSETYNLAGEFKIITIANVQSGYLMINACNRIIELPVDIQPHQMLKKGDILISMTGNVGRTCVVNQTKCLLNQRVGKFDIDKDFISSQFLFELLKNEHFENAMIDAGQGAAQANIGKNDIENYKCYVPRNKAEQKAIATILNDMDKEIDDLEAQRDKYRLLKSGMMQKLLTGQIRLKIK